MRSPRRRRWNDLSRTQQRLVVAAGAVEVALTAVAMRDLVRRPAAQVRGPKALWGMAAFVQPIGPIAYMVLGRRSS